MNPKCPNCNYDFDNKSKYFTSVDESPKKDRLIDLTQCGNCGYVYVSKGEHNGKWKRPYEYI